MSSWQIWVGVLVAGGLAAWVYNRATATRDGARRAWADVDAQLAKRHAFVPYLVSSVGGPAGEQATAALAEAVAVKTLPAADRFAAEKRLSIALERLMVAARTPALQADRDFTMLREQFEDIEVKLAEARVAYNAGGFGLFGPVTAPPVPVGTLRP